MSDTAFSPDFNTPDDMNVPEYVPVIVRLKNSFVTTAKGFVPIYAIAVFTFLLAFPVASITKNQPDVATSSSFAIVLFYLFVFVFSAIIVFKFFHMAIVEKPPSPSMALMRWLYGQIIRDNRLFNCLHLFIAVSLFIAGFGVLKGAIAILHPFAWDQAFLSWDKAIHFGTAPHIWLQPILNSPKAVLFFNVAYNLWFFIIISSLLIAGANMSCNRNHRSYLTAFMLTWLIAGFFIATVFSSAGPCFYFKAGFGTDYQDLMGALNAANESGLIWALPTQDTLWEGFTGERVGSAGISAFPSLHVATTVLIALYASSFNRIAGIIAWTFAAIIMVGSVVLAWHYAVDGYAGAIITLVIWKATKQFQKEHTVKASDELTETQIN